MVQSYTTPAHNSFPLTRQALDSLSLTPEFDYPDPYNARLLNSRLRPPLPVYTPGEITAVGLIGKIYLHIIDLYLSDSCPGALEELDKKLRSPSEPTDTDSSIALILEHFPTSPFHYSPAISPEYLLSYSGPSDKRHGLYKSFLLVFLADSNQALRKKDNLFTDAGLRKSSLFSAFRSTLFDHFTDQPAIQSGGKSLVEFLIEPSNFHPDSLYEQLEYIRCNWSAFLGDDFLTALLKTLDHIKEEKARFLTGGVASQNPLGFSLASYQTDQDYVRFSTDLDWMPNVILLAKNIFVWLDQLSKEYQTSIHQLDQIPDQELAKFSSWGITGLWLIGLWQRSSASQRIKQICGNLDAVPSAYSLFDYTIADSLGGEEAYQGLSQRAAQHNIRLAADMVPNHMGIYSDWVIEHPDWFLSVDEPPFPGYSFQGEDLSEDQRISIFIEDHYYDKTDAAVVFKRIDRHTGSEKYIYHGNDGTSMPWNDTAQLDFLNPEVREAVIQKILYVAKKFPIIRFDAAMTLAKKHIQRLWFPEPGSGGAIPTRSDYGLNRFDFDKLMPDEFWREVVDRVAAEAPDTLLLAEAFWMMEGYFVRSLGMHRVYNSAFMHMLRDEDNCKYRDLIIKTLEYDPQILKRYVNFMNNPDEDTAISQYGSDGKYFGVCVLMSTLPGLPMLGHGQIEGLSEKYGMEYQRAYYNEEPNQGLIERHKREIFPLLQKRYLFADVENFALFDFTDSDGNVNENVFAFTNRVDDECALIVYHNKWGDANGSIQNSVSINGNSTRLINSLGLSTANSGYLLFRDHISGLEYIRPLSEFSSQGVRIDLGAYDYRVYMDFSVVSDEDGSYARLSDFLNDIGVYSLQDTLLDLKFDPLSKSIDLLCSNLAPFSADKDSSLSDLSSLISAPIDDLISHLSELTVEQNKLPATYKESVIRRIQNLEENFYDIFPSDFVSLRLSLVIWSLLYDIYTQSLIAEIDHISRPLANQPYLSDTLTGENHIDINAYLKAIELITPVLGNSNLTLESIIKIWFTSSISGKILGLSDYEGITWFNKESFEILLDLTVSYLLITESPVVFIDKEDNYPAQINLFRNEVLDRMKKSNYQVDIFHETLLRFVKEWTYLTAKSRS